MGRDTYQRQPRPIADFGNNMGARGLEQRSVCPEAQLTTFVERWETSYLIFHSVLIDQCPITKYPHLKRLLLSFKQCI